MQAQAKSLPEPELPVPPGLWLITEDALGVAQIVGDELQQRGAQTRLLTRTQLQPDTLTEALTALNSMPIAGIIHLAPLDPAAFPESLTDWQQHAQMHVKSLFQLVQCCLIQWRDAPVGDRCLLSASLLGGTFGRCLASTGAGAGLATGGGASGLLKTAIAEANVRAKAIDFDRRLSPTAIAECVIRELLTPGSLEVGYPQGQRTVFRTVPAPLSTHATPLVPTADWVVLVTGGARGITAETLKHIIVPGMRLILVGRSPEPDAASDPWCDIHDPTVLRQQLIQQFQAQGASLTPVQIEHRLQKLLHDRTIRENLAWFRQRARVDYHAIDVRDESAMSRLLEQIYTNYGRLDAVIHGAGLIEDKLIVDKPIASFDRVYATKADSAFLLSRYLQPASLKLLVFFSSVAGRYGNRGQSDYAAANEVVNRLAWQLAQQWTTTRVVALNWGPWDTTGMASESVKRQFRDRGIIPIPLEAGSQFFANELRYGSHQDVEIIAGAGPWSEWENAQETVLPIATQPIPPRPGAPLFTEFPQFQPDSTVTLTHTFCLDSDPYLRDHQLDGKLVLPATGAIEWLAELVQSAWTDWVVAEVRDLRVLQGLVINPIEGRSVLLKAKASSHADAESLTVTAEILDPNTARSFYRATLVLRSALDQPPLLSASIPPVGIAINPAIAYSNYLFHGSAFQLIRSIDCANQAGMVAQVSPSSAQIWTSERAIGAWLFDPGMLDTAPQLAIIWARLQHETTALPSKFGSVVRYSHCPLIDPLRLVFRVKSHDAHHLVYDAFFVDQADRIHRQMTDIESTCNSALNRLAQQNGNL